MENIEYYVRRGDRARVLSSVIHQAADRLLGARSASDLESIGHQLVQAVRGIAEEVHDQRAAAIAFMAGIPKDACPHGGISASCPACVGAAMQQAVLR